MLLTAWRSYGTIPITTPSHCTVFHLDIASDKRLWRKSPRAAINFREPAKRGCSELSPRPGTVQRAWLLQPTTFAVAHNRVAVAVFRTKPCHDHPEWCGAMHFRCIGSSNHKGYSARAVSRHRLYRSHVFSKRATHLSLATPLPTGILP